MKNKLFEDLKNLDISQYCYLQIYFENNKNVLLNLETEEGQNQFRKFISQYSKRCNLICRLAFGLISLNKFNKKEITNGIAC